MYKWENGKPRSRLRFQGHLVAPILFADATFQNSHKSIPSWRPTSQKYYIERERRRQYIHARMLFSAARRKHICRALVNNERGAQIFRTPRRAMDASRRCSAVIVGRNEGENYFLHGLSAGLLLEMHTFNASTEP